MAISSEPKFRTALKKTELVFKINEEFIEITADGRRATSKEILYTISE